MKDGRDKKANEISAVDCEEIGCLPNLSESELENGSGWWLHYTKIASKGKVWKFAIKLEGTRIDHKCWLDGSAAKQSTENFSEPGLASLALKKMIADKKREGYKFLNAHM